MGGSIDVIEHVATGDAPSVVEPERFRLAEWIGEACSFGERNAS
jgi:hypothetical protein